MPGKIKDRGKPQNSIIYITENNNQGKEIFGDGRRNSPYPKRPFSDFNYQTEAKVTLPNRDKFMAPIPKTSMFPPNSRKESKTPEKKLFSPNPEIKKPKPISRTPIGQNPVNKITKQDVEAFKKSPVGKMRKCSNA